MKIRFGENDVIDTQNAGAPENYEEVENAALDTQDTLDDGSTSFEDQTQISILKRFVKGFLAGIANDSGRGKMTSTLSEVMNALYDEFDDVLESVSDSSGWAALADEIQYDDKEDEQV